MKNIVLFDTSIGTLNHGDEIIVESFKRGGKDILDNNFVLNFPTHTPCFHAYQQSKRNTRFKFVCEADYKFVCGTNILNNKMHRTLFPFWNINLWDSKCYKNSILVGVGVSGFKNETEQLSFYSKLLYSKILSKEYKHSVRDERTKYIVESICGKGSAINTGCPTLWALNQEHCLCIPESKGKRVVFTLTDYAKNRIADQSLIDILCRNYGEVYFWPQGSQDINYFRTLNNIDKVLLVPPDVSNLSALFSIGDIDYIGTRLHAGIFAMQHKVRSIILIVDNRAMDMAKTYNINAIERSDEKLEKLLNMNFKTQININENNILSWKSQFN